MITFTWSPAASYTTAVFFPSPGVSFDFASFNFHVPIFSSSAAKHAAPAKKQSARVNPIVFLFMPPTSTDFQAPSMFLSNLTNGSEKPHHYSGNMKLGSSSLGGGNMVANSAPRRFNRRINSPRPV